MQEFYSNGKLLLSGEYAILDGALGLAIPTKYGQSLKVSSINEGVLYWKSFDADKSLWFEAKFSIPDFELISSSDIKTSKKLHRIFQAIRAINPEFLRDAPGLRAETHLSFPRNWGLGTSSTLINNIAAWAKVDAHELLQNTFGGSGYDIACAQHDQPIVYQLKNGKPLVKKIDFKPPFLDALFFVYLNKKRNSREAISNFRELQFDRSSLVGQLSGITEHMSQASSLSHFESLITEHEEILAKVLGTPTVKSELFPDYPSAIKSLGAWGGDFIMVTGDEGTPTYFKSRGFETILPFAEMAL